MRPVRRKTSGASLSATVSVWIPAVACSVAGSTISPLLAGALGATCSDDADEAEPRLHAVALSEKRGRALIKNGCLIMDSLLRRLAGWQCFVGRRPCPARRPVRLPGATAARRANAAGRCRLARRRLVRSPRCSLRAAVTVRVWSLLRYAGVL